MKKFKELKDKQKVLAVFGILGLVLILTGVTYAFFTYSKSGSTENTLKSGSITFWYDEQNREGNGISIEDALPISDANGKIQTKAFNFKIQSTTSSTTTIPYEITLRQKAGTDNIGNIVKVYLAKTSSIDATVASEEEVELSLFSSLSNVTKNGYSEKLLHTDIVPASDSPYTQNYRLKMWVDSSADYSDGTLNNKTFSVMVNVYAEGRVVSNGTIYQASEISYYNTNSTTCASNQTIECALNELEDILN